MLWGNEQDQELLAFYRELSRLRQQHPVLWEGQRRTLHVDGSAGTYVYAVEDAQQAVVVAMNLSDAPRSVTVSLPFGDKPHTFTLGAWDGTWTAVS